MAKSDFFSIAAYKANLANAIQQTQGDRISQSLAQAAAAQQHAAARKEDHVAKMADIYPTILPDGKTDTANVKKIVADRRVEIANKALNDFDENKEIDWTSAHERKQYDAERERLVQEVNRAQSQVDRVNLEKNVAEINAMDKADRQALSQYVDSRDSRRAVFGNTFRWFQDYGKEQEAEKALVEKYGEERLKELAEAYSWNKNEKEAQKTAEEAQKRVNKGAGSAVLQNLIGFPARALGAVEAAAGRAYEQIDRTGQFGTLQPYTSSDMLKLYGDAVVGQTAKNIAGENGGIVRQGLAMGYQGITGAADSIARIAFGGGGTGALALAAAGSFTQTLSEASQQGATPTQAVILATGKAGMEVAAEKLALDELFDIAKSGAKGAQILREMFKQAGVEITEEELSLFGGLLLEAAVLREKSGYKQTIAELMDNGKTYEEARKEANKQIWNEVLQTAFVSGISGMVSGLSGAAYGNAGQKPQQTKAESFVDAAAKDIATKRAEQQGAQSPVTAQNQTQEQMPQAEATPAQAAQGTAQTTQQTAQQTGQRPSQQQMIANALADATGKQPAQIDRPVQNQAVANNATTESTAPQQETASMGSTPTVDTQNQSPEGGQIKGTGAAERGFTPKTALINEYGNIPEGENPVRPDQLPQSTNGEDRVSRTARTALEARVTPDEFVPLIENNTVSGGYSYIPIRNDDTVQAATNIITREGWQTTRANWAADVRSGRMSPEITATGALLYNHAVNAGDYQEALDILADYQMAVRNTAQSLQAARILKTLTPSDRLYMLRRSIDAMVRDMNLDHPVTIDETLAQEYQRAGTEEEANEILDRIARDVARQIPPTLMERFTALRYLNMLGNFKTQVRNVAGNIGSKLVYGIKDKIKATIEILANAVTDGAVGRTTALVTDRATRQAANADFDNVRDWLMGNGRYDDRNPQSSDFARRVQESRRILPPGLEQYRRATNWAMDIGDTIFARDAYARALAGYLNANGIHTDDLNTVDEVTLNLAREYAVQQAQEQTFRDNNQVSDFVSGIMRGRNTPVWARVIGEGVMPFRRTPANVLVRAEEYSPLGLINSTVNTIRAARGEISGTDLVESWSKSLTGTALVAMGYALANMGMLSGGPDEDEEQAQFDQLNGKQDYALEFDWKGERYSYTIDWATPAAMPLFVGAQLQKLFADEDVTWADMEKVVTAIGDPMIRMSMLQGVGDTLDNVRYAENNLGQFLINSVVSYLTQGLSNTLLGQIERATEENRQTTYIDKDSGVPVWLQKQLGKVSQKIPGWDYQQTDYVNAWGEKEKNEGGDTALERAVYNMFSPGYLSKEKADAVSEELTRLREATNENVFPDSAPKTITYTGKDGTLHKDYNLSEEEYETLQRVQGQEAAKLIADLVGNRDYEKLTDKQKASVMADVYAYADEQGKKAALSDYHSMADSWIRNMKGNKTETIIRRTMVRTLNAALGDALDNMKNGWDSTPAAEQEREELYDSYRAMDHKERAEVRAAASSSTENYLNARDAGMKHEEFVKVAEALYNIKPEEGKKEARAVQKVEAIASAMIPGLSKKEREMMVRQNVSESQNENIDQLVQIFKDNKELQNSGEKLIDVYAKIYRDYEDYTKGSGKKNRTIQKWMKDFDISYGTAESLYKIFS